MSEPIDRAESSEEGVTPANPPTPAEVSPVNHQLCDPPAIELYQWQAEALAAWRQQNCRGIVEAVTGAGKSMLGVIAARDALADGGKVQVVVPTRCLQDQWFATLQSLIPDARIGRLGGRGAVNASLLDHDIVIAVVNTQRSVSYPSLGRQSLIVADECHRLGTECNSLVLNPEFERRLGLSATCVRDDEGDKRYLDPYFGSSCYELGYAGARAHGVIAPLKLATVGVSFVNRSEEQEYADLTARIGEGCAQLEAAGVVSRTNWSHLLKRLVRGYTEPGYVGYVSDRERQLAASVLTLLVKRKDLLAKTVTKKHALVKMRRAINASERTIVFTDVVVTAEDGAADLRLEGVAAAEIYSEQHRTLRDEAFRQFAQGHVKVLLAPRILDEGVDIPEADLGIVCAASRSRRQMIQRLGRVMRRKADGRCARFVILYVKDTVEDPSRGAHEEFVEEVSAIADGTIDRPIARVDEVVEFLNDFKRGGEVSPCRAAPHWKT